MDIELLTWFGNLLNFLILAFLSISIVNTQCFDLFQMILFLIGLFASIFIQIVAINYRRFKLDD